MKSLAYLNQFGATSIEVQDSRPAGVVFRRKAPLGALDRSVTFSPTALTVQPQPGNDITEIINYSTANVRYRVKIVSPREPLVGSTITWPVLPSGVTVTSGTPAGTYQLQGINKVSDWEAVKNFTWTVPSNYSESSLFFLEVSVIYYDQASLEEKVQDWVVYDPEYYFVSEMTSSFSFAGVTNPKVRLLSSNISSSSAMTATATKAYGAIAPLSATASLVAEGGVNIINANAVSSLVVDSQIVLGSRSYLANKGNQLFTKGYVYDADPSATLTLSLSCPDGIFSYQESVYPTNPWAITGTASQINAAMVALKFYPTKNYYGNTTVTYTVTKGGIVQYTQDIALTGSNNSYNARTLTFTSGTTLILSNEDRVYGYADVLVVGGGGGGRKNWLSPTGDVETYRGTSGGGGGVVESINLTISNISYAITVGSGGSGGTISTPGGSGSASQAFGLLAGGGQAGQYTRGGTSGSPQSVPSLDPVADWVPPYPSELVFTYGGGAGDNAVFTNLRSSYLTSTFDANLRLGQGGGPGPSKIGDTPPAGGWGGDYPYYGKGGYMGFVIEATGEISYGSPGVQGVVIVKLHA